MSPQRSTPARFLSLPALALLLIACTSSSRASQPTRSESGRAPIPQDSPDQVAEAKGFYGPEPTTSMTALESETYQAVRRAFPAAGKNLLYSSSLTIAARRLAQRAAGGESWSTGGGQLRADLAAGLSFDPAPVVQVVTATRSADIPAAVARVVSPGQSNRIGIGTATGRGAVHAVVLLAHRLVSLHPFPREVSVGKRATIGGELTDLSSPRVFVTLPSGKAVEVGQSRTRAFEAPVSFGEKGRYLIEVIGSGSDGPEVAALLAVSCGGVPLSTPRTAESLKEPDSVSDAEAQVVEAIQKARAQHHLPPLRQNQKIADVARRHSQQMRSAGRLSHVLPGSGDVGQRLRAANIPYRRVLENVALASTSLAAHRAAEESPAHLRNILDPDITEVGCGVVRGPLPGGGNGVYLTEIFVEEPELEPAGRLSPEGMVREALWRQREKLKQPPLLSDTRLDELARETAQTMLRQNEPSGGSLGRRALELGRRVSAADVFVAASPDEAAHSPNLQEPQFKRVGVGVALGDSPQFGAARFWIAVVYTD